MSRVPAMGTDRNATAMRTPRHPPPLARPLAAGPGAPRAGAA